MGYNNYKEINFDRTKKRMNKSVFLIFGLMSIAHSALNSFELPTA